MVRLLPEDSRVPWRGTQAFVLQLLRESRVNTLLERIPSGGSSQGVPSRPNQDYLVPYRTAFLLYVTVRIAVTRTAFIMERMICKVFCNDPNRQKLKAVFVYCGSSESSDDLRFSSLPGSEAGCS